MVPTTCKASSEHEMAIIVAVCKRECPRCSSTDDAVE